MRFRQPALVLVALTSVLAAGPAGRQPSGAARLVVANPIDIARPSETIVLDVADLGKHLSVENPRAIHVKDDKTGADLLTQAVDLNDDGKFEQVIFQSTFAPNESKTFSVSVGEPRVYKASDFKAYGRFIRERRDDFAWENDLIAHRMYGEALETWAQEPLTSSGVDVWVKRTPRLVINDWYMVDDYHRDNGEGADLYSVGKSRGCGGNSVARDGKLFPSINFRGSRVLANGPIRVLFELTYQPWDAGGTKVSEVKRISLDAGQHFDRFDSVYTGAAGLQHAVGIKKATGADVLVSREQGTLRTWETFKNNGDLGCAVVVDPAQVAAASEADGNTLLMTSIPQSGAVTYFSGFGWSRADTPTMADWDRSIASFARRVRAPLRVRIEPKS